MIRCGHPSQPCLCGIEVGISLETDKWKLRGICGCRLDGIGRAMKEVGGCGLGGEEVLKFPLLVQRRTSMDYLGEARRNIHTWCYSGRTGYAIESIR